MLNMTFTLKLSVAVAVAFGVIGACSTADVASLTYDVTSICEEHADDRAELRVRIVNENGWKIDDMVYAF